MEAAVGVSLEELFEKYNMLNKNDKCIRNMIAIKNQRLVIYVVNTYYNKNDKQKRLREDLIQEGNIGLLTAIDKYRPELGYRFSTYAIPWIRQSISNYLVSVEPVLDIPMSIKIIQNKVLKEIKNSNYKVGVEEVLDRDFSFVSKKTASKVKDAMNSTKIDSVDDIGKRVLEKSLEMGDIFGCIDREDFRVAVKKSLKEMPKRERILLLMRYEIIKDIDEDIKRDDEEEKIYNIE